MGCGSQDSESDRLRSQVLDADFRCWHVLYQRPETVTREGFPNQRNSDSMLAFERSGIDGNGGIDHPT
jgi:hypothetical protein